MNEEKAPRGDRVRVSVQIDVSPGDAFRIFTEEIDLWWRRGPRFRVGGRRPSVLCLEPRVGGRLFEAIDGGGVVETGLVTVCEPPSLLIFEWRAVNFAADEKTEVEVRFEPSTGGTLVTLTHSGWSRIRPDHPARHGQDIPGFIRMYGMWWGDVMTALREHAATQSGGT